MAAKRKPTEATSGAVEELSTASPGLHPHKALRTLQARAALIGVELLLLDDGTLFASKWGWSRSFPTLNEVAVWLDLLGAPR
jgi:hypothetical protein